MSVNPNIWSDNIEIIEGYNETADNEFQSTIVDHPSDKTEILEELNMLSEVLSAIFNHEEDKIVIVSQ
jgi:hypothetical protein